METSLQEQRGGAAGTTRGGGLDNLGMPVAGSGGSSRRTSRHAPRIDGDAQARLFWMFAALLIGITVFQKIGYAPRPRTVIPVIVPLVYAVFGFGILFAKPVIRPMRVGLYLLVVITSTASATVSGRDFSMTSMMLYFVLYLPMVLAFPTTPETYRRCMGLFCTVMLGFACVVWLQHLTQLTIGWRYWPNPELMLPKAWLIPDFIYLQPIRWGLDYMKPSGIVFLEVSTLSQFIALALIMELVIFRRMVRAGFLAATLFATFAGTGLLLLLAALPIIITRVGIRTTLILAAIGAVVAFAAFELHWFDLVSHRVDEFGREGTSGTHRFIDPVTRIFTQLRDPNSVFMGIGPGQIEFGPDIFWWPITKTVVEYGLIQGLLFYGFIICALFDRAPNRAMSIILILWFSFEATLLTPYNPIALIMLSTMFMVRPETVARRRSGAALPRSNPNNEQVTAPS